MPPFLLTRRHHHLAHHTSTHRDILRFEGFRSPWYKQLLFAVLGVCTAGVLFLVAKWSLTVRVVLRLKRCRLKDAQYVRTVVSTSSSRGYLWCACDGLPVSCHGASATVAC